LTEQPRRRTTLADLPPPPSGRQGWPWTVETPVASDADAADWPTITVITPSYNQGAFIEATLRSVLLQGYPKVEYLVLDGGSTDGAAAIIEKYAAWLSGWRSERDAGQSDAINKGFSRAGGQLIAWLNSDDRYLPGTLQSVARKSLAWPKAAAWVGSCVSVDMRGRKLGERKPRGLALPALADWLGAGCFSQPASFYEAQAVRRTGPLDQTLHSSFDVDFFLRLARQGEFVGTSEVWAEETIHPDAKTAAHPGRSLAELRLVQIRNGFEQLALERLTRELQEYQTLKRGTTIERILYQLSLGKIFLKSKLGR
jgi:GT2 family glycosyltransferase